MKEKWVAEHIVSVPLPDWAAASGSLGWGSEGAVAALTSSPARALPAWGCWSWDVWDQLLKSLGRVGSRQVAGKPCQGHLAAVGRDFRVLLRAVGSAASL